MEELPRAFPNPGLWCWVNALVQALASVSDPRWWAILDAQTEAWGDSDDVWRGGKQQRFDLLTVLSAALRWVNRADCSAAWLPRSLMLALEGALVAECGLSPSAEQDVHEAYLQALEAIYGGLLRREHSAVRHLAVRARWAPLRPGLAGATPAWAAAVQHRQWFLELFRGILEEMRVCCACGLAKVDRRSSTQAFYCLSLEMPSLGSAWAADVTTGLHSAFGGGDAEHLDDVLCGRCTLLASIRKYRYEAARGSLGALRALSSCRVLEELVAQGGAPPDAEHLRLLMPPGASPPEVRRAPHRRTFKVARAPDVLALHLNRLTFGPYGPRKLETFVRYPLLLPPFALCGAELDAPGTGGAAGNSARGSDGARQLRAVISHLGQPPSVCHFFAHRRWGSEAQGLRSAKLEPFLPPWGTLFRAFAVAAADAPSQGGGRLRWVCANDDSVAVALEAEAIHLRCAYLLFYERYASS